VRRLASTTLFELQDAAREVPGNTKVSALIMQRSTESLELLATEAGDDLSLQRELSEAWTRLAVSSSSSSAGGVVGDAAAAERHLRRAIELSLGVLRQSGDDESDLARLVEQQWRLAEVLATQGKDAEGLTQARVAVATARRLRSPARASRVKLAGALQQLSSQLMNTAPDEALALVLEEREVLQALLVEFPGDVHLESSLAFLIQREGSIRSTRGEPESCALIERALELRRDLAASTQTRSARRALSQSHASLGNCFHRAKETEKALAQFELAVALREVLVKEDPADADASYLLLSSWSDCLDERPRLDQFTQALEGVDEHHRFGEALLARDPNDLNVAMKLVEFEWNVGLVYKRRAARGDGPLAQLWLQRALTRLKAVDAAGHLAEDDRWMLEELPDDLREAADAGVR
jgi:tetratricopeptide (TPR) repeat protein